MTGEEFKKKQDELLEVVPLHYRSRVEELAWDYGHSAGYQEVINHLLNLVEIFEEN